MRLCSLINEARKIGMTSNPMKGIKSKRTNAKMHKPFDNINEILEVIKAYNKQLYLMLLNDLWMSFKTSS